MTSARWQFTLFNYDEHLETLSKVSCKYLCYGKEICETTHRPHLQGYVVFHGNHRLPGAKKKLPGAPHMEAAKGNTESNVVYCSKQCTEENPLVEFGERPLSPKEKGQKERERWQAIIQHAKAGTLEEHDPKVYFMHLHKAEKLFADNASPLAIKKTVKVFYGVTGSGKTHLAWEEAGSSAYAKDPRSKFWYGYAGQTNVIIDEFRGGIDISHMLRWLDNYPTTFEIKNSSRVSLVSHIWITSNIHPSKWYPDLDAPTLDALLRRLQITEFDVPCVPPASGWIINRYTP